ITVKGPDGLETIRTRTRIWAAGVQASPLARMLAEKAGVETDRAGRIPVGPDCTVPGHPEVFAIGDMASFDKLPGVAQPAIQEGKYVGRVIKDRLAGRQTPPFRYFDKGTMATIGYRSAVADAFGVKVTGFPAYVMWIFIHVLYLVGWGNRFGTLYTWARALWLTHSRGNLLISFQTAQQDLAEGHTPAGRPPTILPRSTRPPTSDAEEAIPGAPREVGSTG
ncbi:MAG TPA: FAD-dependent oxidoreductase, partial [Actinomycetes bacterium]|nr:FAD-dependent oxidoreductase [Actinomycetes bacterium]